MENNTLFTQQWGAMQMIKYAWALLRDNMQLFGMIMLIVYVPIGVVNTIVEYNGAQAFSAILTFASLFGTAALYIATETVIHGKQIEWRQAFQLGTERLFPLIGMSLLSIILLIPLFILLVIPGVYVSVLLSFSAAFVVLRKKGIMDAFRASMELVKGRWWKTFGALVLIGVLVTLIPTVVVSMLLWIANGTFIGILIQNVFVLSLSAFMIMVSTVLFLNWEATAGQAAPTQPSTPQTPPPANPPAAQ